MKIKVTKSKIFFVSKENAIKQKEIYNLISELSSNHKWSIHEPQYTQYIIKENIIKI